MRSRRAIASGIIVLVAGALLVLSLWQLGRRSRLGDYQSITGSLINAALMSGARSQPITSFGFVVKEPDGNYVLLEPGGLALSPERIWEESDLDSTIGWVSINQRRVVQGIHSPTRELTAFTLSRRKLNDEITEEVPPKFETVMIDRVMRSGFFEGFDPSIVKQSLLSTGKYEFSRTLWRGYIENLIAVFFVVHCHTTWPDRVEDSHADVAFEAACGCFVM